MAKDQDLDFKITSALCRWHEAEHAAEDQVEDGEQHRGILREQPVRARAGVFDPFRSPTGDEIVFAAPRGPNTDGPTDIYTVSVDGEHIMALTDDEARDLSPTWSPDGTQIAFSSDRNGVRQVFVMKIDGSDLRQITSGPDAAAFPSWGRA